MPPYFRWLCRSKHRIQNHQDNQIAVHKAFCNLYNLLTGFWVFLKCDLVTEAAARIWYTAMKQTKIGGMKMASKRFATVDKTICVACGACEKACPLGAIKVHKGCFAKVAEDKCVGCGRCEKVCPANSIIMEGRKNIWKQRKSIGMITYGYGPSYILHWDFSIFYLPGSVWSISCCRSYLRYLAATSFSATIFAAEGNYTASWVEISNAPETSPRPNG